MRLSILTLLLASSPLLAPEPPKLKILFLGDNAGHQPATRFKILQPVLAKRGIDLTYTDKLADLNPKTLGQYDGLLIYANHTKIAPEQEKALIDYVESGKGFIPLHCASYCFLNSPKYIAMVGAQFRSHGTGTFRSTVVKPDHPIMQGYQAFSSWDETYVHTKHNEKDRTVLEVRTDGDLKEPWTWVRTQGKGRVFYTAWGHDQRTWEHPGFANLVERGIRWACGQDPSLAGPHFEKPEMTKLRTDVKPFEYEPAKIPFYPPSRRWGVQADPITKMQKPLSVEESLKHFVTPGDFEVKVFVTEEKLGGKPIAMNWDEQGRLWVAITRDYPNDRQSAGEGHDRIVVCTDEDGDGACDTVATFAEKLSIPTSVLPYAGGLIVHQAPVTLFLKDTDGDGKADVRHELLRGWATNDTHAGPSNLHYGFDNWIYGAVGYAGFRGEVNGERINFRQGFYRFKVENPSPQPPPPKGEGEKDTPPSLPGKGAGGLGSSTPPPAPPLGREGSKNGGLGSLKVTKLEFLRSTNNNTWGLAFDESGQLFGSTANGCPIVHMPIPNRYYEKVRGLTPTVLQNIAPDFHFEPITEKVRQVDWHGGFTAASNLAIYTARTYPREYWNRAAFLSDPTGHLTSTFTLQPDGATYKARYGWNLLASDDEWTAPIDAQVGPDGHVWVIDWYNFIVQHNPTPQGFRTGRGAAYETPLRDKTHGRIYRVVYTKAKPEPRINLKDATPEKLVETLKHHNLGWRLHAQRLLVERGKKDVVAALVKLVEDKSVDETGLNAGAVQAVWTLTGLKQPLPGESDDKPDLPFDHPSSPVRSSVIANVKGMDLTNGLRRLAVSRKIRDSDPQVQLAAALAGADLPMDEEDGQDKLGDVLSIYLREPNNGSEMRTDIDPVRRDALLMAASRRPGVVLYWLSQWPYELSPEAASSVEFLARQYGLAGGDSNFSQIISILADWVGYKKTDMGVAVISGFSAAWPASKSPKLTPKVERDIALLLPKLPASSRGKLLKLASTWGVKGLDAELAKITKAAFATLADAKAKDSDRVDAAKQIIEFAPEDGDAVAKVLAAITPQASNAVANGFFEALAASKSESLGSAVVAKLKDLSPTLRPAALRLVLARPDATGAFLDAVEKGTLRFDMLALDQKTALASSPDRRIARRAQKILELGGGLPNPDRQKVIEEFEPLLKKSGDVAAGKKVFTAQCAKCHLYAGEGTNIGPDLTGFAVHPKEELLIHILDPSRSVEGNFKAYRVVTLDGRTLVGILGAQTATSVEIIDGEAKRHALAKEDIETLTETDKSLMPEGFEKQVKPQEIVDLLEFLTQKGKFIPLPLDKAATIVSTKGMFISEDAPEQRLIFDDWKPQAFEGVPFVLIDPQGDKVKNVILLNSDRGSVAARMPKSATVPLNAPAKAIHLLSGVSGWGAPFSTEKTVSMIVRLHYEDGKTEDHEFRNGVHFADYIRRVDVEGSKFAFALRGQQIRYLKVEPKRTDVAIKEVEFVKGPDRSAPVVMAATAESP